MKAIVYTQYGTPDNLSLQEVARPVPRADEVLIRVQAASINSWDWDLLRGKPFIARLDGLLKPQYDILGCDIAGVIEATGTEVTKFRPGDAVFGDISAVGWGGFAEYVSIRPNDLAKKPEGVSFTDAAAIPQAGVLALQGLRQGGAAAGKQILINGAGGGVGSFAIQLAKLYGAEVTAVDHASKLEAMHAWGADHVIDYSLTDFLKTGTQYDLILDVVARHDVSTYGKALHPDGKAMIIGGQTSVIFSTILLGSWSLKGGRQVALLMHKPNASDLDELAKLVSSGKIRVVLDRTYTLKETAEAMRYFGSGEVKGKIVIEV